MPAPFRQGGIAPFSTITLLKSAPAAVHVDGNGIPYACMTSVASEEYRGGTFCLVERGLSIAVRPGDLLIAATWKNEHCNLSPVVGTKFSVIAYFKNVLRKNSASSLLGDWLANPGNPGGKRFRKKK